MKPALSVEKIGKQYPLPTSNAFPTLREVIARGAGRLWSGTRQADLDHRNQTFWALRDVSFSINRGEVVGIIGNNGAGKSTILKVLSRITDPTEGRAIVRGRLGALLEVGTGFHPELNGRDNIYLNGAILGMTRREIAKAFDEIVDFSGVEPFIDMPVKRYSSGMYLRLAFAVAAFLETEVLIVDEVLAVGDIQFQEKCLRRIRELATDGRTVIMVSHNLTAVQSLCSRAIRLDKGKLVSDGQTRAVLADYFKSFPAEDSSRQWDEADAPGNEQVRLCSAVVQANGQALQPGIDIRTPFSIVLEYENLCEGAHLNVTFSLSNEQGVTIFEAGPYRQPESRPAARYRETCRVPGDLLNDGRYFVSCAIQDRGQLVFSIPNLMAFDVLDNADFRFGWYGEWAGVIRPKLDWLTERIGPLPTRDDLIVEPTSNPAKS